MRRTLHNIRERMRRSNSNDDEQDGFKGEPFVHHGHHHHHQQHDDQAQRQFQAHNGHEYEPRHRRFHSEGATQGSHEPDLPPPKPHPPHRAPPPPPAAAAGPIGPLPFPTELFYIVIDRFLYTDIPTLLRLSRALPMYKHYCWTHAFSLVPIFIREREGRKQKRAASNVDLFLQLLSYNPEILHYIGGLSIEDHGRQAYRPSLGPTSEQDLQTLAMLLVQSKRMPKLRTFKIRCLIPWQNLPETLQKSFDVLFQSRSLQEVLVGELGLPINLLALIPNLRVVDVQTGGVGPPAIRGDLPLGPRKQIELLKIRDRNLFGQAVSTLGFADGRKRPFSLSSLQKLEVCLPGHNISSIQVGLNLCTSLQSLKVFVGTAGGLPQPLELKSMHSLKSLTLSADVISLSESEFRFLWLIHTLTSLTAVPAPPPPTPTPPPSSGNSTSPRPKHNPTPSTSRPSSPKSLLLEDLTILVRIDSLQRAKECSWADFDALFLNKEKWAALKTVNIVWCTGRREDLRQDLNQDFVDELPVLMPNLWERKVLKVQTTYSDSQYNFWTFV